jgi:hypothetical protein
MSQIYLHNITYITIKKYELFLHFFKQKTSSPTQLNSSFQRTGQNTSFETTEPELSSPKRDDFPEMSPPYSSTFSVDNNSPTCSSTGNNFHATFSPASVISNKSLISNNSLISNKTICSSSPEVRFRFRPREIFKSKGDEGQSFIDAIQVAKEMSLADSHIDPKRDEFITKEEVEEMGSKLQSQHLNGISTILRRQFPHIGALYGTQWGAMCEFPPATEPLWIQPVHVGIDHWATIAKGYYIDADVVIFDSLISDSVDPKVVKNIASILNTKNSFTYMVMRPTQQRDSVSCGLYAAAFATALAFGLDPETLDFAPPSELRQHLKQTFLNNLNLHLPGAEPVITPFPYTGKRTSSNRKKIFKVDVCGTCCLPLDIDSSDPMIQCDRCSHWFHRKCQDVPEQMFTSCKRKLSWNCSLCADD